MLNLFGVAVFHTSMVNWRQGTCALEYMCILLYVKLIWCMVLHRSMVNWREYTWPMVYVHSAICETYLV